MKIGSLILFFFGILLFLSPATVQLAIWSVPSTTPYGNNYSLSNIDIDIGEAVENMLIGLVMIGIGIYFAIRAFPGKKAN